MSTKTALLISLFLLSSVAHADWLKLEGRDDATLFIDAKSVRKDGDTIKFWTLVDFMKPQKHKIAGGEYMSERRQQIINCRDETWDQIYVSYHTQHQATGGTLTSHKFTSKDWNPIPPNSPIQSIAAAVCPPNK